MPCPRCASRQVLEIDLTVSGRDITLHSCPACETRWWDAEGEQVDVTNVIDLATVRK